MEIEFFKKLGYTHMPYIFYDNSEPKMLFTILLNLYWKLYFTDFKNVYKVETPLDNIFGCTFYHMCQPTCYKLGDLYKISFCTQYEGIIKLWYVETKNILDCSQLVLVKDRCWGGAISPKYIIINLCNDHIYFVKKPEKIETILNILQKTCFDRIIQFKQPHLARTSYVFGNDDQIIISYAHPDIVNCYGSIFVNLNDIGSQKIILSLNDLPLYKATIDPFTETVYFGKKVGCGFELRLIHKTTLSNIKTRNCEDILNMI